MRSAGISKVYQQVGRRSRKPAKDISTSERRDLLINKLAHEWNVPGRSILAALQKNGVVGITQAGRISRDEAETAREYLGARTQPKPLREQYERFWLAEINSLDGGLYESAAITLHRICRDLPDFLALAHRNDINTLPPSIQLTIRTWNGNRSHGFEGKGLIDRTIEGLNRKAQHSGFESFGHVLQFLRETGLTLSEKPDEEFRWVKQTCIEVRAVCKELKVDEIQIGRALRLLRGDSPSFTERRAESRKAAGAKGELTLTFYFPRPSADLWWIRFKSGHSQIFRQPLTTKTLSSSVNVNVASS